MHSKWAWASLFLIHGIYVYVNDYWAIAKKLSRLQIEISLEKQTPLDFFSAPRSWFLFPQIEYKVVLNVKMLC